MSEALCFEVEGEGCDATDIARQIAARLVQDLEPSGLECGREIEVEICAALRAGPQDAQDFSELPKLFRTLDGAHTGPGEAIPSRLAAAGLTAAEVDTRLM